MSTFMSTLRNTLRLPIDQRMLHWNAPVSATVPCSELECQLKLAIVAADCLLSAPNADEHVPPYSDAHRDLLFAPMFYAARVGNVAMVVALREWGAAWEGAVPDDVPLSELFERYHWSRCMTAIDVAAMYDQAELLEYLMGPMTDGGMICGPSLETTMQAIAASQHMKPCLDTMQEWLTRARGANPHMASTFVEYLVYRTGNWADESSGVHWAMDQMLTRVPFGDSRQILHLLFECVKSPAKHALIDVLWTWLINHTDSLSDLNNKLLSDFISANYAPGIQRLRNQAFPVPWPRNACTFAASNGHLALLKILHADHCECSQHTAIAAARAGHVDVLMYIYSAVFPTPASDAQHAVLCALVSHGHMQALDAMLAHWRLSPAKVLEHDLASVALSHERMEIIDHLMRKYMVAPVIDLNKYRDHLRPLAAFLTDNGDPARLRLYLRSGGMWFTDLLKCIIQHNMVESFEHAIILGGVSRAQVWPFLIAYGRLSMLHWMVHDLKVPMPDYDDIAYQDWNHRTFKTMYRTDATVSDDIIISCIAMITPSDDVRGNWTPTELEHAHLNMVSWAKWAIATNRIQVLRWISHHYRWIYTQTQLPNELMVRAIEHNCTEGVQYLFEHTVPIERTHCEKAISMGSVNLLRYLCDHCAMPIERMHWEHFLKIAVENNHLPCVAYLYNQCRAHGEPSNSLALLAKSLAARQVHMADFIYTHMCVETPNDKPSSTVANLSGATAADTATTSLSSEPLARLQHLHACMKCPWTTIVCAQAAMDGDLVRLQWLHENHCPWDEYTCSAAARVGNLDILRWAHEHGCPMNAHTHRCAMLGGHLHVVKFLHAIRAPVTVENIHDPTDDQRVCQAYVQQNTHTSSDACRPSTAWA